MSLFNSLSYKSIIKGKLKELRDKKSKRYTFEALSRACRVQKTYLSKVLNHKGNLNTDQLYRACEYLKLTADETDYVFLVYEFENTQIDMRRKKMNEKILEYRKKYQTTETHIEVESQIVNSAIDLTNYYADPYLILVHMFCTVQRFAENPSSIGEFLGLSKNRVAQIIAELCAMGILEKSEGLVKVLKDNTHLSKGEAMYKVYRSQMRLKALENMNKNENPSYSFSVVFSSVSEVRDLIQENFMKFLKDTQKLVQSNNEEEVYQMNFDLLSWTELNSEVKPVK